MDELKKKIIEELKALGAEGKDMQLIFIATQLAKEELSKPKPRRKTATTEPDAETPKEPRLPVNSMESRYQSWYSKALPVIRQLLPERYDEFRGLYRPDKPPKEYDAMTYTISDYLLGFRLRHRFTGEDLFDTAHAAYGKFNQQCEILDSAIGRVESSLSNIEGLLQAKLFERELAAASELLKKGYVRAAGVLAGISLEAHLAKVAEDHGIKFRKANPTISDFNDELRKVNVIDVPVWRHIQRLGDIRNMSAHSKERKPRTDEVEDLIVGTEKIIATVS